MSDRHKVISLEEFVKKKISQMEAKYCESLEVGWEVYDELEQIAPYLPKPIILKIMTLCRRILKELDS